MTQPIDVSVISNERPAMSPFSLEDAVEALKQADETCVFTQIAQRRSQLEDAETLRRVRAL